MSKIVIYLTGKPSTKGHKIREFLWSEPHRLFLYQGREFAPEEFNAAFDKAFKTNADLGFRVKFTEYGDATEAEPTEPLAPISTITASREITLEEAEAVVQRIAPHRLKKKTGPKGDTAVMEVA